MLLPYRLLALELRRNDTWSVFLRYQRCLEKQHASDLRVQYIKNCMEADIIPRFLRFRIPNNGCFDNQSVHEFQKKLLKKELIQARADNQKVVSNLNEKRELLKHCISDQLLVSVAFYSRQQGRECRRQISATHYNKLLNLSEEQEKPLFSVKNTVVTYELDSTPPDMFSEHYRWDQKMQCVTSSNQTISWQSLMVSFTIASQIMLMNK